MELVEEFMRALDMPAHQVALVRQRQKWRPPKPVWVNINVDGDIDARRRAAGIGMVAHDHLGLVLSGRCRRYEGIHDPFTAELLACRDAMGDGT